MVRPTIRRRLKMNMQETNETRTGDVRSLSHLELDAVTGGCVPVWVKGPYGIEGLSPTLDRGDPRLQDPNSWVQPHGV
jgi:hypothetical protein